MALWLVFSTDPGFCWGFFFLAAALDKKAEEEWSVHHQVLPSWRQCLCSRWVEETGNGRLSPSHFLQSRTEDRCPLMIVYELKKTPKWPSLAPYILAHPFVVTVLVAQGLVLIAFVILSQRWLLSWARSLRWRWIRPSAAILTADFSCRKLQLEHGHYNHNTLNAPPKVDRLSGAKRQVGQKQMETHLCYILNDLFMGECAPTSCAFLNPRPRIFAKRLFRLNLRLFSPLLHILHTWSISPWGTFAFSRLGRLGSFWQVMCSLFYKLRLISHYSLEEHKTFRTFFF